MGLIVIVPVHSITLLKANLEFRLAGVAHNFHVTFTGSMGFKVRRGGVGNDHDFIAGF